MFGFVFVSTLLIRSLEACGLSAVVAAGRLLYTLRRESMRWFTVFQLDKIVSHLGIIY